MWRLARPNRPLILLGLVTLAAVHSHSVVAEPVLVPASQQATLFSPAVREAAQGLVDVAHEAPERLVDKLAQSAADERFDPAARDAVIYDFVRRVRGKAPGNIGAEAVQWLIDYQPQAERLHEESRAYRVPLFDVSAAARGLANQIEFEAAYTELLRLTDSAFDTVIAGVLKEAFDGPNDSPRAAGFRYALKSMESDVLTRLDGLVRSDPALHASSLFPSLVLARGRLDELADWLPGAEKQMAGFVLLEVIRELPSDLAAGIHLAALDNPEPEIRALGLAAMSDAMASEPAPRLQLWLDRLADMLTDPVLGSAAALQLGRLAQPEWLQVLAERSTLHPIARSRLEMLESMRAQDVLPVAEPRR